VEEEEEEAASPSSVVEDEEEPASEVLASEPLPSSAFEEDEGAPPYESSQVAAAFSSRSERSQALVWAKHQYPLSLRADDLTNLSSQPGMGMFNVALLALQNRSQPL
jgi:hypothetical protein